MRLILILIWLTTAVQAQSLYKVELDERIDRADLVVEARVVGQETTWNRARTLIYTINRLKVYRIFKDDLDRAALEDTTIEVITPGGVLGLEADLVFPSLVLRLGDMGVLFGKRDEVTLDRSTFRPFASAQGFIRYNQATGGASDPFDTYGNVEIEVHSSIERRLGTKARVITEYEMTRSSKSNTGSAPVITSVTPDPVTAGTSTEILITGSGFESYDGGTNSAVFFANADDGGGTLRGAGREYIRSWNDGEIRVAVPTAAGTGDVTVQSRSQQTGVLVDGLTIDFNRIEVLFDGRPYNPDLRDKNGAGGYSLAMSTNTSDAGVNFATSPAVTPFESALETWQNETGFNVRLNGGVTASRTVDPNSDPDIVMFDSDDPSQAELPLPSGTLAKTFQSYSSCDGSTWWLTGFDMVFRRDGTAAVDWNYGPGSPAFQQFDFETVAVHELGHAHQLGHIIARDKVMHFAVTNGRQVRELDPVSDGAGGKYVMENLGNLGICGERPMTPVVGVAVEAESPPDGLQVSPPYPNPFVDSMTLDLSVDADQDVVVEVIDVLGRVVQKPFSGGMTSGMPTSVTVEGRGLAPGVYVIRIAGERFTTISLATRR